MAVSDWSTTPDSNTTIDGLDIAENCSPANINNAIRSVMAGVKAKCNDLDTEDGKALKLAGGTMTGAIKSNSTLTLEASTSLDINTALVNVTPNSGEGGQVNLNAPDNDSTQCGTAIDQYNNTFRLYGLASKDGTSFTGAGNNLRVDIYNGIIYGNYVFRSDRQPALSANTSSEALRISGSNAWDHGARLALHSDSGTGMFYLASIKTDGTQTYMNLEGRADTGTLTWGGNHIVIKRHTFYNGTVSLTQNTATVITGTHASDYHTHIAYEITSVGPGSTWNNAGVQIVTVNHENDNYKKIRVISHSATQNYNLAITEIYV